MARVEAAIDVAVPVRTAYEQWTQFEEFPSFMDGVRRVTQLDDTHLQWQAEVAGKQVDWQAEITQQEPDRRIAWRPVGGDGPAGAVTFEPLNAEATRVLVQMTWEPDGVAEKVGAAFGVDDLQVREDLERFRDMVERRAGSTGAWRGSVQGGRVTRDGTPERPDGTDA